MTFFLDDFDPAKVAPRRGPDIQPQSFIPSWMAATSQMMRDTNASWQRQREVNRETLKTTEPAARKLGIEELNRRYEAEYGGYDHRNPPPQSVDDFYAMHPNNVTNELVLKAARDAASADPAGWADLDISDDGIQARVTEMRKAEDQDEAEILSMSNYPGLAGLAGGITGAMADVRNVPFMFLGGSGSFLRVMGQEALWGGVSEAVTLPSQYETAKELDKADPDPIEQITLGALGGAVIGGALHGLGRGIEYFRGRMAVPEIPGADPVYTHAAVDAAETALVNGDNPLAAVQRIMDSAPPPTPQQRMVQSEEFLAWSDGTKVADPSGNAMQVYHGTWDDFSEFDPSKGGSNTGAKDAEGAIFFTNRPEVASAYVADSPYEDDALARFLNKVTGGKYEKAAEKLNAVTRLPSAYASGGNVRPSYLSIKNPYEFDYGGIEYDEKTFTAIIAKARKDGRDGVIIRNVDDNALDEKIPADVFVVFDKDQVRSVFDERNRISLPPLIPEQAASVAKTPPVDTTVLPPAAGEPPRSAAEVGAVASRALDDVEGLNAVLADAKAADNTRSKPLIGWLSNGHRVTKKDAAAGRTAGESLQIDPASTLGQELKAQDITPRTAPGLFKKGGRTNLDNLVASEMEDQFPGIMDATRTQQGADYLDQQGLLDLIVRDANGDASWLRSRADVQRIEADLELALRAADGEDMGPASDYLAMKPDDGGFFVDLNAYQFDNPDWQGAIARDLEAFIAEKWPGVTFTAKERADILNHLTTNGGEAQNLVERLLERELDYGELPPSKVYSHADLEDPAYQRFLDEATASRVSDAGGEDPLGPVENGGAARGGPAGEVGADGQVSIPGTDRVDTGQAQRDAATIAARQQQSKMGRLDQTRVEDDAGGLFGGAQSDLFSDPLSKDARVIQDSIAADFRDQVAREDFKVDLNDGKGERSASSLLDELDGDDEFAAILDACGKGKA